jgi:hypothetical protein
MACIHLQQLYELCHQLDLKVSGSDLVHIVCRQCGEQEVCPSTLMDEYDARQLDPSSGMPGHERDAASH